MKVATALAAALLACATAAGPGAAGKGSEAVMDELRVNEVIEVRAPAEGKAGEVATDRSGRLKLVLAAHAEVLARLAALHVRASIAYDPASREVRQVGSSPRDRVMAVVPGKEAVAVQLLKRPTGLTLARGHPRFEELLRALEEARAAGREVSVGLLPGDLAIQDVRGD